MGSAALASVVSGWTGTIAAHGVTITPRPRESVASIIARLVAGVATETTDRLTVSVSSSGVLTLSSTSTFTLTASGTTATRTGYTGSYTAASTYTAASAYSNRYVPSVGLRVDAGGWVTTIGAPVADGSIGHGGVPTIGRCEVTMWTSFSDAWAAEGVLRGTYDVWHDGRIFARVCMDSMRRTAPGRLRSGTMVLSLSGQTVTE